MTNIFQALNKVMAEVGAIGKNSTNQTQNFKYRGIDAVMNALQPALINNNVTIVPTVLDVKREEKLNAKGNTMIVTVATIKYTFYAEDGSSVEAVVVGEAMDSGDKSMNKAMSVAFKYACFQVLCIPTEELIDSDAETHHVVSEDSPIAEAIAVITPEQKAQILAEVNRTGIKIESLCKSVKCKNLDDFPRTYFEWAITNLKNSPTKKA